MENNMFDIVFRNMPNAHIRVFESDIVCAVCAEEKNLTFKFPVLLCLKHYQEFQKETDARNAATQPSEV